MKRYIFIITLTCCFINGYAQETGKFRLNFSGGMSYMTVSPTQGEKQMEEMGFRPQKISNFVNNYRWGVQGNADIHYFFNNHFGIGVKYILFKNHDAIEETVIVSPANGYDNIFFEAKKTDYVNYIGPSIHWQTIIPNSKLAVSATLSGGYTHLWGKFKGEKTDDTYLSTHAIAKSSCFGALMEVGTEYFLTKQIALGIDVNYFLASFNTVHIEKTNDRVKKGHYTSGLNKENGHENISRLGIYLGLKIYL